MKAKISAFNIWLCSCFAFIFLLIIGRILYSNSITYVFLIWNLFLAFIPYLCSSILQNVYIKSSWLKWLVCGIWLLFFPNALYIITDIKHLANIKSVPIWYDVLLLLTASLTGLVLAFSSLHKIEKFLHNFMPQKVRKYYLYLIIFIGAFGVYLGRFLRLNSWDVANRPLFVFKSIANIFIHPFTNSSTWLITSLLFIFFSLCWRFIAILRQAT